ncbi:nuclear pore complex protein DDB_G0274915 isoform X2 [Aedes aegypti]|uniref:Uncharacterized protein n=1 Tax=Aedes aegypti TaxID=7159 RepID=A0A6I8TEZ1_AEDAE|nr:nuclear pore complex protein DDB_G0274915 isoform X2 [Aedes aegypti]
MSSSYRNGSNSRTDAYQTSYGNSSNSNSNLINNNCSNHDSRSNIENLYENGEEVLDLGDLDLSQLRLSKKDLEALSSITPSLSQRVQEQLLAQLPPQQAKKLSRTLSMQNGNNISNPYSSTTKVYKRSSSSSAGRTVDDSRDSITPTNDMFDNDVYLQKISSKKLDRSSRSSSNSRDIASPPPLPPPNFNDDYGTSSSSRFPYANENHERFRSYEKYTPYLTNSHNDSEHERSKSLEYDKKFSCYESLPPRTSCLSPTNESYGRPPSGCISPPPISTSSGYSSQRSTRRISRFLRPDFFDPPKESSDQEKLKREQETQNILREIRGKSRERSVDRSFSSEYTDKSSDRLNYFIQKYQKDNSTESSNLYRYNSSERNEVLVPPRDSHDQRNRRSISRPREVVDSNIAVLDKITASSTFAEKILDELHNLATSQNIKNVIEEVAPRKSRSKELIPDSVVAEVIKRVTPERNAVTNCLECSSNSTPKQPEENDSTSNNNAVPDEPLTEPAVTTKVVKVKKIKMKPKLDADGNPVTVTVRRIKKVVKSSAEGTPAVTPVEETVADDKSLTEKPRVVKKESKLVRPKSYPSKDPEPLKLKAVESSSSKLSTTPLNESEPSSCSTSSNATPNAATVSKLVRPKSFPSSKLTPPKDTKVVKTSIEAQPLNVIPENPENKKIMNEATSSQVVCKEKTPPKTATVNGTATNEGTVTPAVTPGTTKKVRKVIRIVKKSAASKSDSSTKSSSEEKTAKESTTSTKVIDEVKESKEVKEKRVEIITPEPIKKIPKEKSKSPEKKIKQGFLATIGQKFEKFRESSKMSKDKKTEGKVADKEAEKTIQEDSDRAMDTLKKEKKKSRSVTNATSLPDDAPVSEEKNARKSRIDKVIRNLREMSVPRSSGLTESTLIKRAVSVEEMPGTFNKCSVNKSSSHISTMDTTETLSALETVIAQRDSQMTPSEEQGKERPKSGSFVSKIRKPYIGARSDTVLTMTEQECKSNGTVPDKQNGDHQTHIPVKYSCPDCNKEGSNKDVSKRHSSALTDAANHSQDEKERVRNSRRALTLDLSKLGESRHVQSNNNNYSYPPPLPSEIMQNSNHVTTSNNNTMNMNMLTPSYDSITNYSSGSRSSPYDDCNSSSTFMSPSEEHELYFDNWSICSDDHNNMLSASPSTSRLSRLTYVNSVSPVDNDSESVIERIRRKSFYTRFNEQKPRRVSSILAPSSSKEYYRDQSLSRGGPSSTRLKEYGKSSSSSVASALTSVDRPKNSYDYYRSLTRTPSSSKNKYADSTDEYSKSSLNNSDYYHHHHHHHHYHLPLSNSSRKLNFSSNDSSDNLNYNTVGKSSLRSTYYETSSPPYYNTYNPRRRSSFTSNSTTANLTSSSSSIALDTANTGKETRDTVPKSTATAAMTAGQSTGTGTNSSSSTTISATDGLPSQGSSSRKLRPYDSRSISMLNSSSIKESRYGGYDSAGIIRNGRLRNSSIPRNPTNV